MSMAMKTLVRARAEDQTAAGVAFAAQKKQELSPAASIKHGQCQAGRNVWICNAADHFAPVIKEQHVFMLHAVSIA